MKVSATSPTGTTSESHNKNPPRFPLRSPAPARHRTEEDFLVLHEKLGHPSQGPDKSKEESIIPIAIADTFSVTAQYLPRKELQGDERALQFFLYG